MVDVWATIKVERGALAEDLAGIGSDQWETPSLCDGWTVRDALAHMTASAKLNVPGFLKDFVAAGFNIPKMDARQRAAVIGATPADTLANFRARIGSTRHPPGPAKSWLGEAIVHAEDIRRPLGIEHDYPMEAVVPVADFYKGSNLILGSKKRVAGLTLRSRD